ncbi:hypothetical protein [Kitasatospora nipponensis]
MTTATALIARAEATLDRYQHAPGPEDADAVRALHRDLLALLPTTRVLLAERDDFARRREDARRDPLIGLPTRAAFTTAAEQLLTTAAAPTMLMLTESRQAASGPHPRRGFRHRGPAQAHEALRYH